MLFELVARVVRRALRLSSLSTLALSLLIGEAPASASRVAATRGDFKLVTYNVAGLPEGISRSRPLANLPRIGELLNGYDVALVQEDFAYPVELRRAIRHAHASPPFVRQSLDFGDGLSQFTRAPFREFRREAWASCHGIIDSFFDCLTPKGFTVSRLELAPGVSVHVYNLHMDAGWSAEDRAARRGQIEQLASAIERESAGRAVIVGGDTNIFGRERHLLDELQTRAGLSDACEVQGCDEPWRIDRILFRGSPELELRAERWRIAREFVDSAGRPLSDHLAVAVDFTWAFAPRQN